jgi:hypothetical protein
MERRLTGMRSGVPNWAAMAMAGEWQSSLVPDFTDLDEGIADINATIALTTLSCLFFSLQ